METKGKREPSHPVRNAGYEAVNELIAQFRKRFGATTCSNLFGCDLGSAAGQERFEREELFEECRSYVKGAAEVTGELIAPHLNRLSGGEQ